MTAPVIVRGVQVARSSIATTIQGKSSNRRVVVMFEEPLTESQELFLRVLGTLAQPTIEIVAEM